MFALITKCPINVSPVGETHSTGSAYIAASRPFFAMKLLTMLFDISGFAGPSKNFLS